MTAVIKRDVEVNGKQYEVHFIVTPSYPEDVLNPAEEVDAEIVDIFYQGYPVIEELSDDEMEQIAIEIIQEFLDL